MLYVLSILLETIKKICKVEAESRVRIFHLLRERGTPAPGEHPCNPREDDYN